MCLQQIKKQQTESVIVALHPRCIDTCEVSQSVKIMMCLILPVNKAVLAHLQLDKPIVACVQAGGWGRAEDTKMVSL